MTDGYPQAALESLTNSMDCITHGIPPPCLLQDIASLFELF